MPAEERAPTAPVQETLAWLEARLAGVPDELAEAVRDCVRRSSDPTDQGPGAAGNAPNGVPDLLARAAVEEFERVLHRPRDRETALRLLAADASLTYAFESAADRGDDVLALSDRVGLGGGRIGRHLESLAAEAPGPAHGPDTEEDG